MLATVSLTVLASAAHAETASAPTASDGTQVQASAQSSDIIVTAPRQEEKARETQKGAAVIVNVQSADTIKKYPDYNAAEALGRIPGISLSSDTGEGRFVNIRGIDSNLNGATYGGVVLVGTHPANTVASGTGRAVEFDTVPTGAIDGLVVYKTLSPDREAEGLGGQIDITPRTAKNVTKPFVDIELGAGYEPLHKRAGPYNASIAAGAKLGDLSFVVTASRKDDRRAIDDLEPSYTSATGRDFDRVDFRRYDYSRRRFGYGGELDYTPSNDHRYYARLNIAGYTEGQYKQHFYAQFDGNPSAPDAKGFATDGFQPQIDAVNAQETFRNTLAAVGGEDHFNDLVIDYRASFVQGTYNQDYYTEARLYGQDIYTGTYNNSNPNQFIFNLYNNAALTVPFKSFDATEYGGANGKVNLTRFGEHDNDHEYAGVFNARYPVALFGGTGQIKAGVSIRHRTKSVDDFGGSARFASGSGIVLSDYASSVPQPDNYYFGRYPTAPVINLGAIANLVNSQIPALTPTLSRDFRDKENVTAGYLMYTGEFGKLGVLTGVRIETTDATYGNYLTTTPANGPSVTNFVNNGKKYTNVFPTLQLKYKFSDDLQFRATYSTGIARPGFNQAGGNAGIDFTGVRPVYSAGNPNLKPTTGNNFDLDLEYYLPHGGIIQIGAFDKEFKNYIFANVLTNQTNPIFGGVKGDFVTYVNESAYARGIELAYQQKLEFLPGLLGGLGVEANLTLVKSHFLEYSAAANGTDQYGSLPGTSNVTWNLAGFYERGPVSLRLSAQYVSSSLFSYGGDRTTDVIQAARTTMDLTGSYKFTKNYEVYFAAKNLLNTALRYNYGDSARPQQIEYYGPTYEAGVRIKL
ncbi:MAG: TonB-dependent receptor [Sphingomonas sp.]